MADYKPLNITVITYQGGEVENDRTRAAAHI